ncbi:MAG: tetratricopeptide repeat protein [Candidatus Scalindua rubra]|nr:tetratricopeptide repeat protein [Candidatus Scalindua rubra]
MGKKDYKGLLQYRKRRAERYPKDSDVQYFLGETYVLNGEFEKAIQLLSSHHKDGPFAEVKVARPSAKLKP